MSNVWFVKLFQGHDKLEARDRTKTEIFVPHQTATQLFVTHTSCLKHQNNISFLKNHIKQKIIQFHKNLFCVVLLYFVLFCQVLNVLQTKRTIRNNLIKSSNFIQKTSKFYLIFNVRTKQFLWEYLEVNSLLHQYFISLNCLRLSSSTIIPSLFEGSSTC